MRNLMRGAVGLAMAATLAGFGIGVASALRPTGNAAAIAYARAVAKTYTHVSAVAYSQAGYVVMRSVGGQAPGFSWSWGTGAVPAGWVRSAEQALVGLRRGRVAWFADLLSAQHCQSATACPDPPVLIVVTARGGYWRLYLPGRKYACYRALHGTTPLTLGQPFVSVGGHFGRLVLKGTSVYTHYTYPWNGDRTATETDTISILSGLVTATQVTVSKRSRRSGPGFSFAAVYASVAHAAPPRIRLC
jgi:hypothetical protein